MTDCRQALAAIHLYFDRALSPAETHGVEAHILSCEACHREYESLGSVVEAVRSAHPLYAPVPDSRENARRQIELRRDRQKVRRFAMAAAVLVAALVGYTGLRLGRASSSGDPFASFAADTHLRFSAGKLPLDVRDSQPQSVAAWLTQRLPFRLTLPDYPEGPHAAKKYSLLGARLTRYQDDDVAYLAYEMNGKPISLLIGSSGRIVPAGGQVYQAGGLSFHQITHKGLSTITWVDKGYSYALVSDYRAVGAESCAICHGRESDRDKFAPLKASL
jgi:anti-sigma factor RsiW